MNIYGILTLVGVALLIAALAAYLLAALYLLRKTLFTLGTINVGLRSIALRVEPLEPVLSEINSDLSGVRDALTEVVTKERTPA
ncbi:MAG: hypothetical protein M3N53_14235 [Actinomycetota bacterium]|nr:hypothetical protein [Actinomycetota bacterium]